MAAGLGNSNADPRARSRLRTGSAAGFTLIEVLISVTILGVLSTTLSITISGLIIDSASNRDASVLDAETRRASDALRAMPYHACTSPGNEDDLNDTNAPTVDYQNKMPAENDRPSNVDIIVDSVKYWNGVTPPSGTNIITACPSGAGVLNGDQGLQVITITVKFDDNSFSLQRVVVKRASQ